MNLYFIRIELVKSYPEACYLTKEITPITVIQAGYLTLHISLI
jgi:hypothetical protein